MQGPFDKPEPCISFQYRGDDPVLICPHCEFGYLHHEELCGYDQERIAIRFSCEGCGRDDLKLTFYQVKGHTTLYWDAPYLIPTDKGKGLDHVRS